MEAWMPRFLQFARAYHLSHHDIPNTRYNVFLPLFDLVFGDNRVSAATMPLQDPPRG
jgi:sterol desaturase/sphingolipid hydroxylase (fatty acid hydroxylase superfamily)